MWWVDGAGDSRCPNTRQGPTQGRRRFGEIWQIYNPGGETSECVCMGEILKICLDEAPVHLEINQLWRIDARLVPFLGRSMFIIQPSLSLWIRRSVLKKPIWYWQALTAAKTDSKSRSLTDARWYSCQGERSSAEPGICKIQRMQSLEMTWSAGRC